MHYTLFFSTADGTLFGAALFNDGLVATRKDYSHTEPTVEYNAGITGALAAAAEYYGLGPYAGVNTLVDVLPFGDVVPAPAPAPAPLSVPAPAPVPAVGVPATAQPPATGAGGSGGNGAGAAAAATSTSAAVRAEMVLGMLGAAVLAMLW